MGALIIKGRMALTDEERVEQIKKIPIGSPFFIGLAVLQCSAPLDPSIMVYSR
jgi:hypothetical protein